MWLQALILNLLDALFIAVLLGGVLRGGQREVWLKAIGVASLVVMAVFGLTLLHSAFIVLVPTSVVMWFLLRFLPHSSTLTNELMGMVAMQHAVLGGLPLLAVIIRFGLYGHKVSRTTALVIGITILVLVLVFAWGAANVGS